MQDVSQYAGTLKQGERVYKLDTGHCFKVLTIRDHKTSTHGNEVFRLTAVEVDDYGKELARPDGKTTRDAHGHTVQIMCDAPVDVEATILEATEQWLSTRAVNASHHAKQVAAANRLWVDSREADYIPEIHQHLHERPDPYADKRGR